MNLYFQYFLKGTEQMDQTEFQKSLHQFPLVK
jgi:hypothetical protein